MVDQNQPLTPSKRKTAAVIVTLLVAAGLLYFIFTPSKGLSGKGTTTLNVLSSYCVTEPGYYCGSYNLTSSGMISFTFVQNSTSAIYNVRFACNSTAGASGPSAFNWVSAQSLGYSQSSMQKGQLAMLSGLQCYNSSTQPFGGPTGALYAGFLLVNYTLSSGPPSSANPQYDAAFAALSIHVK